jgi:hypothetical protein
MTKVRNAELWEAECEALHDDRSLKSMPPRAGYFFMKVETNNMAAPQIILM